MAVTQCTSLIHTDFFSSVLWIALPTVAMPFVAHVERNVISTSGRRGGSREREGRMASDATLVC